MIDEINKSKYLFLVGISEQNTNELQLLLQAGMIEKESKDIEIGDGQYIKAVKEVVQNESAPIYQILFAEYVVFTVTNESLARVRINDESENIPICIYRNSKYLEFMQEYFFMKELVSGPLQHYSICCVDHVIDVITDSNPKIQSIN